MSGDKLKFSLSESGDFREAIAQELRTIHDKLNDIQSALIGSMGMRGLVAEVHEIKSEVDSLRIQKWFLLGGGAVLGFLGGSGRWLVEKLFGA